MQAIKIRYCVTFMEYSLQPFQESVATKDFKLHARHSRRGTKLDLIFTLVGPLGNLELNTAKIPDSLRGHRGQNLWKHTAFEIFLGSPQSPHYHEWNFSPSTCEWDYFYFNAYREKNEMASLGSGGLVRPPQLSVESKTIESSSLQMRIYIDLSFSEEVLWTLLSKQKLLIGLNAVLEHRLGDSSLWAIKHASPKADFHNAQTWTCEI